MSAAAKNWITFLVALLLVLDAPGYVLTAGTLWVLLPSKRPPAVTASHH